VRFWWAVGRLARRGWLGRFRVDRATPMLRSYRVLDCVASWAASRMADSRYNSQEMCMPRGSGGNLRFAPMSESPAWNSSWTIPDIYHESHGFIEEVCLTKEGAESLKSWTH